MRVTSGKGESGGSFPHLWINLVDVNEEEKSQMEKRKKTDREREEEKGVPFLSKIYENWAVYFCWSKN